MSKEKAAMNESKIRREKEVSVILLVNRMCEILMPNTVSLYDYILSVFR